MFVAQDLYGQILLPPPPATVPPPALDENEVEEFDMERKKDQRIKRNTDPNREKKKKKKEKLDLLKESTKPRQRIAMFEVSLIIPRVLVTGDRQEYTVDPSSHFSFYWRHKGPEKDGKIGPFWGFRLAPFAGSGIYKDIPGNYGFVYFGPIIGVGSIDPAPGDYSAASMANIDELEFPRLSGWVVATGISAQSRNGKVDEPFPDAIKEDFDDKGVAFDKPGIWLEGRYLQILYGAVGINGIVGIQTGRQKTFAYIGVGAAGWY